MHEPQEIQEIARSETRVLLANTPSFHGLSQAEQFAMYKDMVKARYDELAHQQGLISTELKKIDDQRHLNQRIDQAGDLAGDFIDSVDFPGFVRDLVKGVFDANMQVMTQQTDNYIKLLKAATASLSSYVKNIDNAGAFGYLADNNSDDFSINFGDDGDTQLTDKDGNVVAKASDTDIGDNEVKAKIMDAKIAMAREQRALLRETILMGVTRMVIEKGVIKAAVVFDIKATERIQKTDKAAGKSETTTGSTGGGGINLPFIGSFGGGGSKSTKKAEINISTAKSDASTDLAAKITGSVEINFKSDYFKLDNFATMYAQVQQQSPGQAPGQPPAPGQPAMPPAKV
jgi:hypothetical protein